MKLRPVLLTACALALATMQHAETARGDAPSHTVGAHAGSASGTGAHAPPARASQERATAPVARTALRFTGETPEATIDAQTKRALAPKATESAALAALAVITELAHDAPPGVGERALAAIAGGHDVSEDAKQDAALLARAVAADDGTRAGVAKARALGILTDVAVLGPFRDTGGGLDAHDGPEAKGATFWDPKATYSWGTVEVAWRKAPEEFAQANGLPLDVFVHPRKESCSFVASKIRLDAPTTIVLHLASSGQARLVFDGVDAGESDDVDSLASFDRLAATVRDAGAGAHLVAAKVCTGALDDVGRVRLRVTDAHGAALDVHASGDLAPAQGEAIPWGKAKIAKKTTALSRAIGVKASPGAERDDALLEAAVVRSLGGADDLRSPRAPGELDAYIQGKRVDGDGMAAAAWVSSSGANKSGRLYVARRLASKAGDAATVAFVDRRLVEAHLDTGMADWAIAQLRGTKLDTKKDAEAVLLNARALRSLRVDTLAMEAYRELLAAYRAAPSRVPHALVVELATLAQRYDQKVWTDVSRELARRGVRGESLVDAMATVGKDAVVQAAADAYAGGVDDADEATSIARDVAGAGAHDVAARLFATAVRWSPNRAEAWAGYARELAATSSDPQDKQRVVLALRRARELQPGDAKYRAELALRTSAGKNAAASEEHDDERYLTKIETILARRKGVPAKGAPNVADRELHWLRVVKMHADNRVSQLIHYAREIVIPPRTQQELFEPIPPEGDLTEILRARVYKKSGGVAFPVEEHNDGYRPRIRWPELEAGDTVEVLIRQWTSTAVGGRGDAPFYFMDYAGSPASHPLLYNEVVIETLPGHPLYVDVIHDDLAPYKRTETDEHGAHVVRLVWDKPMMVPEEPLSPALTEIAPVILGSTFKKWEDFRRWYSEAVRGFTEPDNEVRRLAAELTKGKKTREEKLRAIFDFVSDDIRYVNYVSGEWWLPNRPQQLLARREGDCDDKAILLITLLKSVGIDAQEVMVQTRLTGQPSVLLAKNVAVPMFDHGIAFLPGPNGGQYLDATSPQSRLGPIPSMDARAIAFRMEGPAEPVQLPASSPADHGSEVTWTLALGADGSGDLTGTERHTGDGAFWLRSNLTQAEARQQYVEDALVGPWFPTVEVDKDVQFKGDLPKGQAEVKYKAKSKGLARREGHDLVLSLSPSNTYGSSLAPLPTRTQPVLLPSHLAPSHQNRTMRVIAPPGYAWGALPPGGDADGGEFGKAHLEIARDAKDPRVLVIKRSVVFDQHLIGTDKYAAWRSWIQHVDALMHREVRAVGGEK
jgi:hypothetical protein